MIHTPGVAVNPVRLISSHSSRSRAGESGVLDAVDQTAILIGSRSKSAGRSKDVAEPSPASVSRMVSFRHSCALARLSAVSFARVRSSTANSSVDENSSAGAPPPPRILIAAFVQADRMVTDAYLSGRFGQFSRPRL